MNTYYVFLWHWSHCYATFFKDNSVVVYQRNYLERYAERVLNKDVDPDAVFKKYLFNNQCSAFQISLQDFLKHIISAELGKYNVNTASLSPFGKEVGFVINGEINYR